jgi:uncharacterized protein YbaR (Trm112 family)
MNNSGTDGGNSEPQGASVGLSNDFLKILVCPVDHGKLEVVSGGLRCSVCSRVYPVENGIPSFVVDES